MKSLILSLLLFSTVIHAGDWSSGGGDPVLVKALPFPNQALLQDAIDLLKQKIAESPYHEPFKQAFDEELKLLERERLFFYVPDLFAVGLNRFPGDYDVLVSNGAMTEYTRGAPIYFSRQSVTYDARTLARVIAQEIPHHIFQGPYGRHEIFVNGLGTYMIVGGEPPTSPLHYGQIIYEEFVNKPGPELTTLVEHARSQQRRDFRWHQAFAFLAGRSDRARGSYGMYQIASGLESATEFSARKKVSPISSNMELFTHTLAQCVFTSYDDGASGITLSEQKVLIDLFKQYLQEQQDLIGQLYYVEDVSLGSERPLSKCALAIKGPSESLLLLQRVYRHDDDQHDSDGRPFRP